MNFIYTKCSHCDGTGKEIDDRKTGAALRKVREAKKVSLRKLAYICCWSAAYLSDLEKGNRRWNQEKLNRYLESLDTF